MSERTISHSRVLEARRVNFERNLVDRNYPFHRGLHANLRDKLVFALLHKGETYLQALPTFQGQNVVEIIQGKIDQGQKVRILDIGCGKAHFLKECKRKWNDQVDCVGITAQQYLSSRQLKRLKSQGVEIWSQDAQFLSQAFAPGSFDIVTSVYAAPYMADPMAALKGVHRVLEEDGVAQIHEFPKNRLPGLEQFQERLKREYGFEFSYENHWQNLCIAFRKETKRLILPVRYTSIYDSEGLSLLTYALKNT